MANLAPTLSDVQDTARVVEAPAQSSGLATALTSLSKGFEVANTAFQQRASNKRQAAADARAAEDQDMQRQRFAREKQGWGAQDYAATSLNTLNSAANGTLMGDQNVDIVVPTEQMFSGMTKYVDNAADRLTTVTTSVQQGKLPPIALNGLANKLFNEGLNRGIPAGLLAQAFKERGVDAFHDYDGVTAQQQAAEKSQREEEDSAYKQGLVANPAALELNMTRDEIIALGRRKVGNDALLNQQEQNIRMQSALNADARSTNTELREQTDRDASNVSVLRFDSAIEGVMDSILKYTGAMSSPERGSDASYEMQRSKIEGGLPQYLAQVKAQTLNSMRANGYSPSAVSNAEASIDNRIRGITEGLAAGGRSYKEAASLLNTSFGLSMRESAPLLYQMKSLGIDYTTMPGVLQAIDPKTRSAIGSQLKGILSDGVVDGVEKAHFKNLLAVATGKANITDLDSRQGRQAIMKSSVSYVTQQNRAIASGQGDPDTWMSFGRQIALGAASLTPQTNASDMLKATESMVGSGTLNAMNKLVSDGSTKEEALLLAQAKRGASARLLQSARTRMNSVLASGTDKFQSLHFDNAKGEFTFLFNDKLWRRTHPGGKNPEYVAGAPSYAQGQQDAGTPANPTPEARQLLEVLNQNVRFLERTSGWDAESPKGTSREVRAFWATGRPTADMRKQQQQAKGGKGGGNILDIGNSILEGFTQIPNIDVTPENSDIIGPEGTGKNPRSSASGVGQFTDGTWIDTLRKHRPDLIEGKSRADIVAMKGNKELARQAVGWYRGDNAQYLASKGLPSGRTATALAHFAGPQGAEALLTADPNAPVERVLGSGAVNANPHLRGKTASQTIEWARNFYRAG